MPQPTNLDPRRRTRPLLNPVCPACSGLMRLARITPDDKDDGIEIRTYECDCGYEITQILPL